ncbi:MAG: hypothetical protein ACRERD_03760 [Candidatus Binatia bacterium]
MRNNRTNSDKLKTVLRVVKPVFELTPLIRPRLLLAATLADGTPILFGILYHTKKDAYQSRLRFRYPGGHEEVLRATRWAKFTDRRAFERHKEKVIQGFATMTTALKRKSVKVEFAPGASNSEILEVFVASGILEILRE